MVEEWLPEIVSFVTGSGVGGFLTYFFLPKKDRAQIKQTKFENAERRIEDLNRAYQEYVAALEAYDPKAEGQESNFVAIATRGERYFSSLDVLSAAILSGLIDENARDKILVKRVVEAVDQTIPDHYSTVATIARKKGFIYPKIPSANSYNAIHEAAKQFRKNL